MRVEMKPHPDTPSAAVQAIVVDAERDGDALALTYRAIGRMEDMAVPAPAFCERMDELWKHTCFEAFVRGEDARYCEFNFSPSGQWAAYDFTGHRDGRIDADVVAPYVRFEDNMTWFALGATIAVDAATDWQVGLSAVLEEKGGTKSYWALAHPEGDKPDFHDAACFAAHLP